tara:strand:- start:3682 stop:4206 length:525 start_codon:yes stop_codon:yes gene_type:complete
MSRASTWTNNDGLSVGFGARDSKNENAATVRTQGNIETLQFPFDYSQLSEIGTAPSSKSIAIPADSVILRGNFRVTEAFAGGTNYDFGLMNSAGTAIDDDGLDVAVATASLTLDAVIDFDGALIGDNVGNADAYFGVVETGTFTAGKGIVTIEYVKPMPDSDALDPITTIQGTL